MELTRGLSVAQLAGRLLAGITADLEAISTSEAVPEHMLDTLLQIEMANVPDTVWNELVNEAL
jgi:hypothetical protein